MAGWRKSSYSNAQGGSCVELGHAPGKILIRDTKQEDRRDRTTLAVTVGAWRRFTASLR